MFTREQFVEWFSLEAVSRSPAKFNPEKLQWLNNQYMKATDDARLAKLAESFLNADACDISNGPKLAGVVALLKERANTIKELADTAVYFYRPIAPSGELRAQHYTADVLPAMKALRQKLASVEWNRQTLSTAVKEIVTAHGLKNAQAGDAAAGDADRHAAHALDRCGAGINWTRRSAPAHGFRTGTLSRIAEFPILYGAKPGPYNAPLSWGYSSAGRALAWHARGQRFDPAYLHHLETGN